MPRYQIEERGRDYFRFEVCDKKHGCVPLEMFATRKEAEAFIVDEMKRDASREMYDTLKRIQRCLATKQSLDRTDIRSIDDDVSKALRLADGEG